MVSIQLTVTWQCDIWLSIHSVSNSAKLYIGIPAVRHFDTDKASDFYI